MEGVSPSFLQCYKSGARRSPVSIQASLSTPRRCLLQSLCSREDALQHIRNGTLFPPFHQQVIPRRLPRSACGSLAPNESESPDFRERHSCLPAAETPDAVSANGMADAAAVSGAQQRHAKSSHNPLTDTPRNSVGSGRSARVFAPYLDLQLDMLRGLPGFQQLQVSPSLSFPSIDSGESNVENSASWNVCSWLFRTSRLRRIRMTYVDGGKALQAFTSVCYPITSIDMPLLGIDFLSFGGSRLLCVVDFQPLNRKQHKQLSQNELLTVEAFDRLHRLRQLAPHLFSEMTSKFFDPSLHYFSPLLLLYRSSDGHADAALQPELGSFYQAVSVYISAYMDSVEAAPLALNRTARLQILQGQASYDAYFEKNDPALPIFCKNIGEQWTQRYCDKFMFPLSKKINLLEPECKSFH